MLISSLIILICLLPIANSNARNYYEPVDPYFDVNQVTDAIPKAEPKSRYGNPSQYKVFGQKYTVLSSSKNYSKEGVASWYGPKFNHKKTSSGEEYDMYQMTAANKELPLPTYAQVTNLENGHTVIVKINDRGPFKKGRIIDLSYAAAKKLDMTQKGTAKVRVTAIDPTAYYPTMADLTAPLTVDPAGRADSINPANLANLANDAPAIELTRYVSST